MTSMCLSANKGRFFYTSINQSRFKGVKTEAGQSFRFWSGLWAPMWPLSWVHFLCSQRSVWITSESTGDSSASKRSRQVASNKQETPSHPNKTSKHDKASPRQIQFAFSVWAFMVLPEISAHLCSKALHWCKHSLHWSSLTTQAKGYKYNSLGTPALLQSNACRTTSTGWMNPWEGLYPVLHWPQRVFITSRCPHSASQTAFMENTLYFRNVNDKAGQ